MIEARRLAIAREFTDLRATDPYPPMVSTLGALSEPGKAQKRQRFREGVCQNQSCAIFILQMTMEL